MLFFSAIPFQFTIFVLAFLFCSQSSSKLKVYAMEKKPNINLTSSQKKVLKQMKDFVFDSDDRIFILKGYAGTGKTTLMRFLIEELKKQERCFTLLSTTGRAAKILSNHTDCQASTIHSLIYKYADLNKDLSDIDPKTASIDSTGQIFILFEPSVLTNNDRDAMIYIIDEASMVSDIEQKDVIQAQFGSGKLLTELLEYDDLQESKFIFVGDPCQLPPVMGSFSPALMTDYFQSQENSTSLQRLLHSISTIIP